jgi:hypothetical protein
MKLAQFPDANMPLPICPWGLRGRAVTLAVTVCRRRLAGAGCVRLIRND